MLELRYRSNNGSEQQWAEVSACRGAGRRKLPDHRRQLVACIRRHGLTGAVAFVDEGREDARLVDVVEVAELGGPLRHHAGGFTDSQGDLAKRLDRTER